MPELEHVHSYRGRYCEAKPGEPPMMVPRKGTNCPKCKTRLLEHQSKMKVFEAAEREHRKALEAEWAEIDRKKTGSR